MGMMFHRYSLRNRVSEEPKPVPVQQTVEEKAEQYAEPITEPFAESDEVPKKEQRKPYQRGRKRKS